MHGYGGKTKRSIMPFVTLVQNRHMMSGALRIVIASILATTSQ